MPTRFGKLSRVPLLSEIPYNRFIHPSRPAVPPSRHMLLRVLLHPRNNLKQLPAPGRIKQLKDLRRKIKRRVGQILRLPDISVLFDIRNHPVHKVDLPLIQLLLVDKIRKDAYLRIVSIPIIWLQNDLYVKCSHLLPLKRTCSAAARSSHSISRAIHTP